MDLGVYGLIRPTTSNGNIVYYDENGDEQQICGEYIRCHYINPNTIPEGKHVCYIERQEDDFNVKLTAWERGLDGKSNSFKGCFVSDVPVPHKARVKKIYDNRIVFELEAKKGAVTSNKETTILASERFQPTTDFASMGWGVVDFLTTDDF